MMNKKLHDTDAAAKSDYAIGDPAVIAQMAKVKDSYNCDAIAIAAASAALDDVAYARANWQAIRAERERLSVELERRRRHGAVPGADAEADEHLAGAEAGDRPGPWLVRGRRQRLRPLRRPGDRQ